MLSLHAGYLYLGQDVIVRHGFLEHDDYQSEFRTYTLSRLGAAVVALMGYAGAVIISVGIGIVWKAALSGGWIAFHLFVWLPERYHYLRKYCYTMLGFGFMVVFALGFFTSLYYLFFIALWLLSWSISFKYGHLPKTLRGEPSLNETVQERLKKEEDK